MAFEKIKSSCGADLYLNLQTRADTPLDARHVLPITLKVQPDMLHPHAHMHAWQASHAHMHVQLTLAMC